MAVTYEVQTPEGLQGRLGSAEHHLQLADSVVWKGTIAMQVAGKFRAAAGGVNGSTLLGVSEKTYTTALGVDRPYAIDDPAVFTRGVFGFPGFPGDLPTDADIGKDVYIADNYSIKKTMATDDLAVKLVAIAPPSINSTAVSSRLYFVEIK